jgi:hypothetical protein
MENIFTQKSFNYFVWTPLRCNQSDIVATTVFGTSINGTGGKFTDRLLTLAASCHQYKKHQRYQWQNLPPMSLIAVANLSPMYS